MPCKSICAQNQCQFDFGQVIHHRPAPSVCAKLSRRRIAPFACTRKTKPHWKYANLWVRVKRRRIHPQPFPEPRARRVIKGLSLGVRNAARRLPRYENSCLLVKLKNRVWPQWQASAKRTGPHVAHQRLKTLWHLTCINPFCAYPPRFWC